MNKPALKIAVAVFLSLASAMCMSDMNERLNIDRQVRLSPGHHVMPYSISRTSNGDFIVFGANNEMEYRPWATRIAPSGEIRWEFLEGDNNGWEDTRQPGQSFSSAINLPDNVTLLCGIKIVDNQRYIVLSEIDLHGHLIAERTLKPHTEKPGPILTNVACIEWTDGIALVGGISGVPSGTGWIAKLDSQLNIGWQKFGDEYGGYPVIKGPGDSILYINSGLKTSKGSETSLVKLGPSAELLASHAFLDDDNPMLVHSEAADSRLKVALLKDTLHTEIVDLDDQLRGPTRVTKLHNVGVKKCLELPDGSVVIFGSQFRSGVASAAVTRVEKDGNYKTYSIEPSVRSPWYFDAVPSGVHGEFVAVRLNNDGAQLDWLSFK